jgi:hypothetical protein
MLEWNDLRAGPKWPSPNAAGDFHQFFAEEAFFLDFYPNVGLDGVYVAV